MICQTAARLLSRLTAVSCCLLAASLLSSCETGYGAGDAYIARTNLALGHVMNAAYEGVPLHASQNPGFRYPRDPGFDNAPAPVPHGRSRAGNPGWNFHERSQPERVSVPSYPHTGGYGGHHDPRVTGGEYEPGHSTGNGLHPTGAQRKHVNVYP